MVLFLLVGLLGIITFSDMKKTIRIISLSNLILCLLIEALQLFAGRNPNVDDVILNMAARIAGGANLPNKRQSNKQKKNEVSPDCGWHLLHLPKRNEIYSPARRLSSFIFRSVTRPRESWTMPLCSHCLSMRETTSREEAMLLAMR